jgi:hypothetical protein
VDLVLDRASVAQVQDIDRRSKLADAVDRPFRCSSREWIGLIAYSIMGPNQRVVPFAIEREEGDAVDVPMAVSAATRRQYLTGL